MYDKMTMLQLFSALPEEQQQAALGSVGIDASFGGGDYRTLGRREGNDELETWQSKDVSVDDSDRPLPYTDGIHIKQSQARAVPQLGYLGDDDIGGIEELSMYQPEDHGMRYGSP